MKKTALLSFLLALCLGLTACGSQQAKAYHLNEDTFFLVMTNMQYYPEQYLGSEISFDCFTYELQDVSGKTYLCGVRKCSAGYGCTCGKDTVIGFILEGKGPFPAPISQSEDSNEKAWIHLTGKLKNAEKTTLTIHSYLPDGTVDPNVTEQIQFLVFQADACEPIADYSKLHYYVTK